MWVPSQKTYTALFLGAFAATYLAAPLVRRLGLRLRAFDQPSARRVNRRRVPTLGGLAVAAPLYGGLAMLYLWPNAISAGFFDNAGDVAGLLVGGLIVLALGVYDDLRGAAAGVKLPGQVLAALVVCALCGVPQAMRVPLAGEVELGIAAVPMMVFWMVAVTNAFNLIDGVDGLAAGVGFLICGANFLIARLQGHMDMMVFSAIMSGSLLAFLRFNFHPASIFLGDTGSMFLGFTIATASLRSSMKASTTALMVIPVCVLGYPLLDTTLAVVRRYLKGKPIFSSDRSHIHHKLLASGLGHRGASAVACGLTALLAAAAVLYMLGRRRETGLMVGVVSVVLLVLFKRFGYWEFIRDRFSPALRRKYRVYNMVERAVSLRMCDAGSVDELWGLVCQIGREFDLHEIELRLPGADCRRWTNPSAHERSAHGARQFSLPGAQGTLSISHNGHEDPDIELEQNILLERVAQSLATNIRRVGTSAECAVATEEARRSVGVEPATGAQGGQGAAHVRPRAARAKRHGST